MNQESEIWKPIKGYEEKYMVSNLGRVKSLKDSKGNYREKILKPGNNKQGYLFVELSVNNKKKKFYVHRLVAETFILNPYGLPEVNHIDENTLNNSVQNLEWCNNRYNKRYSSAKKVGCYKDNKLIKIYNAIIDTKNDGFNYRHVCSCCKGNIKTHLGFTWRYIEQKS